MHISKIVWLAALGIVFKTSLAGAEVTLVSWNLGNYLSTDRMTDVGYRTDYPKPESEKASLRAVLLRLRPDVLLVQEIGVESYLVELQRDLAREGLAYGHRAHTGGSDEDRHLGLLSRWPLREASGLSPALLGRDADLATASGESEVRRGLLAALVEAPGGAVAVFTVHLKSRRTVDEEDPGGRLLRAAEARAVRESTGAWLAARPGVPGVIAGDFNCGIDASELRSFAWRGERQLWTRLPAVDAEGESWTYMHARSGSYSTLDHAFVARHAGGAGIVATATVEAARENTGEVRGSDHRPLLVRIRFAPPSERTNRSEPETQP